MQIRETPVDLDDVIGFCRHVLEIRAQTGNVRLSSNLAPNLPAVWGDALKLNQAVLNLLTNAVKFTPPGGSVVADAALRDGALVIEIRDTGVGMAPDQIPLALEPFGQLENGFARSFDGTGLGLPLASELIALHGGRLEIESALGQGTTARIILPPERLLNRRDPAPAIAVTAAE